MKFQEHWLNSKQNNFDFIRLLAALLVFIEHAWPIFTGKDVPFDICRYLFGHSYGAIGILMFFSLSGFLVAHSYLTTKHWLKFIVKRFLRIWPGLTVNILLTVLILGTWFSSLPFGDFIIHEKTLQYFENILIYRTYYFLPGVFNSGAVNGSLWTIAYEFTCYLIVSLILFFNFMHKKWILLFLTGGISIFYLIFQLHVDNMVIPILGITLKSLMLPMMFFFSGTCFYFFRDKLGWNAINILISVISILFIMFGWWPRELMIVVLPYLVLMTGFSRKIRLYSFGKFGDISYGFYLYAFPVKKCFASIVPDWPLLTLIAVSLITTLIL